MNKFLVSLILFIAGIGIGASLMAAHSTTPVIVSAMAQATNTNWPYCNEPPAVPPFFNPCPEGTHIDKDCADKCGKD